MTVWYNADKDEIISNRAHDKYLNDLIESYSANSDDFEAFLNSTYYYTEVFNFNDADRERVREEFMNWLYERADANDIYKPYDVRLASAEVEE